MFDELDDGELDLLEEETREDDEQTDMPTMGEVSLKFSFFFNGFYVILMVFKGFLEILL